MPPLRRKSDHVKRKLTVEKMGFSVSAPNRELISYYIQKNSKRLLKK
ncbi:hypothetical protein [Metabacillus sp. RGM 3146]